MNKITISHGSGGKATQKLIKNIFFKHLGNDILLKADDAAIIDIPEGKAAFTTDSFVVKPYFFPGGDIGKIAICGTVNDLAVNGAKPEYLTCGFIIEEGFPEDDLEEIVISMGRWASEAGVKIVSGDTKVVEKGEADGIFINTSGVGAVLNDELGIEKIKPGNKVIITGTVGDHGLAVLSRRKELDLGGDIASDCAPLNKMLKDAVENAGNIVFMRDPTRGGLATTLNEIVEDNGFGILIEEENVPVNDAVKGACELLGLDPLYMANEGKTIIIADEKGAEKVLSVLKKHEYGKDAALIGEVTKENTGKVCLKTRYGSTRIIDMMTAEQLPRIC